MEEMTPQERFTKIENLLATLTETQIRHEAEIDKHNAAIRDLIVVSRTMLDSIGELRESQRGLQTELREEFEERQKRFDEGLAQLREAQKITDEKLHILIETVDRIIRNQQK